MRLKGGDPFVFGRGGEEAEALAAAGVPFEVVPGVTAGVAAPAYAGIPVTHRDAASAVAFVTGHEDPEKPESALDWDALARFPGTLVLYMGVKNLPLIAERLIAAGRDPQEPVAVVERGTQPDQRTLVDTLAGIGERVAAEGVRPPAVTLVGPVGERCARRSRGWSDGRSTVRWWRSRAPEPRPAACRTAARAGRRGGRDPGHPDRAAPPRGCAARRGARHRRIRAHLPDEPERGAPALRRAERDRAGRPRPRRRHRAAAIGPGTAAELERHGVRADVLPEQLVAEALVEALAPIEVEGRRVLVARAAEARSLLPDALRERGAEVDEVALYETVAEPLGVVERGGSPARNLRHVHTSSSTVRFLLDSGERPPDAARVVSIGPITSATAREHGLTVHVEAERHDVDGLVDALTADAAERRVPA